MRRMQGLTPSSALRRLPALVACALLPACVSVQVDTQGQGVRVVRHFGLLQLELPQASRSVVADIRGVGLLSSPLGLTAGYTQQRLAWLGPDCRAVLWLEQGVVLDAATRAELGRLAGLCLVEALPAPAAPAASAASSAGEAR